MRPDKELKAFEKIHLEPGESQKITFTLDRQALSFYDTSKQKWAAEKGVFEVLLGSSSRDIRLAGRFILI
jgi:beta-glucosidase